MAYVQKPGCDCLKGHLSSSQLCGPGSLPSSGPSLTGLDLALRVLPTCRPLSAEFDLGLWHQQSVNSRSDTQSLLFFIKSCCYYYYFFLQTASGIMLFCNHFLKQIFIMHNTHNCNSAAISISFLGPCHTLSTYWRKDYITFANYF